MRTFFLGWLRPEILVTEKFRKELNEVLQGHWKDDPIEVHELVLEQWNENVADGRDGEVEKSSNFIVYIDQELGVDWLAKWDLDKKPSECVSSAEAVGARRCQHLPREQVLELKRMVGQAIVSGIRGNIKQSCDLTKEAAQFLKDRTVERSRAWTLTSAHCVLAIMVIAVLSAFKRIPDQGWLSTDIAGVLIGVSGGLIGAYLSLIQKAGRGDWDAASGRWIHVLEVFSKIVAGAVFGGIAIALSRSVHAPPSLKTISLDSFSMFLLGVVSGLFERKIPRMLSKYADEGKHTTDKQKDET